MVRIVAIVSHVTVGLGRDNVIRNRRSTSLIFDFCFHRFEVMLLKIYRLSIADETY